MTTIEELKNKLAMLTLDPRDFPGTWTQRQRESYQTARRVLEASIRAANNATATLAETTPKHATDTAYCDALNLVRAALCAELLALPQRPRSGLELGQQMNLKLSIMAVDRGLSIIDGSGWCLETLRLGVLLHEAGIAWQGTLPQVERRIREAQARVDEARQQLADALRVEVEIVVEPASVTTETTASA
jgi:hypothetical protein